jgi:hypothetical protein
VSLGVRAVVVRTPFEDFLVRVRRGGPSPGKEQLERARWAAIQFRFGIEMSDPGVVHAARALIRLLDSEGPGLGHVFSAAADLEVASTLVTAFGGIAARLERELLSGQLIVERQKFASLTARREIDVPDLPPLPPAKPTPPGTSFIAVRLIDQRGAPAIGRPFQIELPDGSVHRGLTDPTGFGRVAGFREAGKAKVSFPMLDEFDFSSKNATERIIIPVDGEDAGEEADEEDVGEEQDQGDDPLEAPEDPDALSSTPTSFEVLVVDPSGEPVAGLQVSQSFPDDEQVAETDDSGVARFVDAKGRRKAQVRPTDIVQARSLLRPRFQQGLVPTVTQDDGTTTST